MTCLFRAHANQAESRWLTHATLVHDTTRGARHRTLPFPCALTSLCVDPTCASSFYASQAEQCSASLPLDLLPKQSGRHPRPATGQTYIPDPAPTLDHAFQDVATPIIRQSAPSASKTLGLVWRSVAYPRESGKAPEPITPERANRTEFGERSAATSASPTTATAESSLRRLWKKAAFQAARIRRIGSGASTLGLGDIHAGCFVHNPQSPFPDLHKPNRRTRLRAHRPETGLYLNACLAYVWEGCRESSGFGQPVRNCRVRGMNEAA